MNNTQSNTMAVLKNYYKSIPTIIIILLIFFLLRGLIFISVIPPWQAPDEPLHYDYMHYLATEKKWPVLGNVAICGYVEKSLRGYYFSSIIKERMPYRQQKEVLIKDDYYGSIKHDIKTKKYDLILKFENKGKAPNQIIQHPPLYYFGGAISYLVLLRFFSLTAQIWLLRLFSVILGLMTVYIAWLSSKLLFKKQPYLQYAVVAFVALQPMFAYIFSIINNDSLTIFLFSLLFYQMLVIINDGVTPKRMYGIALVFGLGMLTKISFAVALPAVVFVIAVAGKKEDWQLYLKSAGLSLLIVGWWYLRVYLVYKKFMPRIDFYPPDPKNKWANISLPGFLYFTGFKNKIFSSFWGSFGWLRLKYPYRIFFILKYMTFLVVTGLGLEIVIRLFKKVKWDKEMKMVTLSLGLVFLLLLSMIIPSWAGIRKTGFIEGVQGRYLFPLMIPLAYLLALGVNRLVSKAQGFYAFVIITFSILILDFLAIFRFILPYFYG